MSFIPFVVSKFAQIKLLKTIVTLKFSINENEVHVFAALLHSSHASMLAVSISYFVDFDSVLFFNLLLRYVWLVILIIESRHQY